MTVFYHGGAQGDIIYSLPTIKGLGGGILNVGKHNQYLNLKELLILQDYIEDVVFRGGYHNQINLSMYTYVEATLRSWKNIDHLAVLYTLISKDNIELNLYEPWLFNIQSKRINKIVINRTKKYRNVGAYKRKFDWSVLQDYRNDCIFVGTEKEHFWFKKETGIETQYYTCKDALELAEVINGCDLFIGNQSLAFALAEALKKNRVLEVCWRLPNCVPATENSHIELCKNIVEKYIQEG